MEVQAENPPTIVESRSCRVDKKLVAFIIEKEMILNEPLEHDFPYWWNIKSNDYALKLYNNYERQPRCNWLRTPLKLTGNVPERRELVRLNQMIAYSVPNSYQLLAAYVRRASMAYHALEDYYCIYNMMHAEDANEDIECAVGQINLECKHLLDSAFNRRLGAKYPTPQKEPLSSNCFSYGLCKDSPEYGRQLYTSRSLMKGTIVLRELPFISLLLPVDRWTRCHHCLIYAPLVLIPCRSCSVMLYCSHTCRNRAYQEYHSLECALMPTLLAQYNPTEFLALRLTIRVFQMFYQQLDELSMYIRSIPTNVTLQEYNTPCGRDYSPEADYKKVYRLATNRRHLTRAQLTANGLRGVALAKLLVRQHNLPSSVVELLAELTVRHMHILRVNALVLHRSVDDPAKDCFDATSVPYALTLLTTGSMFNHACDENVGFKIAKYGRIEFVANRFIRRGAKLHINYRLNPADDRFTFECFCHRCRPWRAPLCSATEHKRGS